MQLAVPPASTKPRWPEPHLTPFGPHEQSPLTHWLPVLPQATQAVPSVLQPVAGLGAVQVLPLQQPVPLHRVEQPAQAPLTQVVLLAVQSVQLTPPVPQVP